MNVPDAGAVLAKLNVEFTFRVLGGRRQETGVKIVGVAAKIFQDLIVWQKAH